MPDYYAYTGNENYPAVVVAYNGIERAIYNQLKKFYENGFTPINTFLYGFSFGGQLSLGVGRRWTFNSPYDRIYRVDTCDTTSVGFEMTPNSKLSARNVHCVHTNSFLLGTEKRDCHRDWNMGVCGEYQLADREPPSESHNLCPIFYNIAFTEEFPAIPKPFICKNPDYSMLYTHRQLKMGYMETQYEWVSLVMWNHLLYKISYSYRITGEFYAKTTTEYPYNWRKKEVQWTGSNDRVV